MTSYMTKEQIEKFLSIIKEEFPYWDENISNFPNITISISGDLDINKEELAKNLNKEVEKIKERIKR